MSDWIKCINSMPVQGQNVLVFGGADVSAAEYWIYEDGVHEAGSGFFDFSQCEVFPVTHWQPMPAPPAE